MTGGGIFVCDLQWSRHLAGGFFCGLSQKKSAGAT